MHSSGGCSGGFTAFTNSLTGFYRAFPRVPRSWVALQAQVTTDRELQPVTVPHSSSRADWWPRRGKREAHDVPKCHVPQHSLQYHFQKIKSDSVQQVTDDCNLNCHGKTYAQGKEQRVTPVSKDTNYFYLPK